MFIEKLSKEQQSVLLDWAYKVIEADGVLDEEELNMFDHVRAQCAPDVTRQSVELTDLHTVLTESTDKKHFLLELIGFCFADGVYHESEKKLIRDVSTVLEVSTDNVEFMEQWVEEQMGMMFQIQTFIGE